MSVVLLGIRSRVVPRAWSGLKVLATWLGVASIVTVCAEAQIASIRARTNDCIR